MMTEELVHKEMKRVEFVAYQISPSTHCPASFPMLEAPHLDPPANGEAVPIPAGAVC